MKIKPPTLLFILALLLLIPSCGGSGGSNGNDEGSLAFLVGDAPTDELSSFSLEIEELRLRNLDGVLSDNLLSGPRTIDVLGLGLADREALLGMNTVPADNYESVYIRVDPLSFQARDLQGMEVLISAGSMEAEVDFQSTNNSLLPLKKNGFASVSTEIVLDQCLIPGSGSGYTFNLVLRAAHGQESPKLDDFTGQVVKVNKSAKWFEAEIVDARYSGSAFGVLRVEVDDESQLFQFTGSEFGNSNAFLANLKIDDLVEIEGFLTRAGTFEGERCEIEDRHTNQIRLEGRLLSVDVGAQSMELLWEEIEKGYAVARPVLIGLGDPGVLDIVWDNKTKFLGSRGSTNAGADDLVPGQKLEVRFDVDDFVGPMPFTADKIRVDGEERYEGIVDNISALPSSFQLEIDGDHPGVNNGRITDPVQVDINGDTVLFLDTGVSPWLDANQILSGMRAKLSGKLTGSGTAATLDSTRIEIEPGRLSCMVMAVDANMRQFTAMVNEVSDPFGGTPPSGVSEIQVDTEAVITLNGESATFGEFRNHFQALGSGEELTVQIEGIGQASGTVLAFELEAESD